MQLAGLVSMNSRLYGNILTISSALSSGIFSSTDVIVLSRFEQMVVFFISRISRVKRNKIINILSRVSWANLCSN